MYKNYEYALNFATQEVEIVSPGIRRVELVEDDSCKMTFQLFYDNKRVIISGTTLPTGLFTDETDLGITSPTYSITVKYPTGSTTTWTPTKVTGEEKLEVTFDSSAMYVGTTECELIITSGGVQIASCKFSFYTRATLGTSSIVSTCAFEYDSNLDLMPVIASAINDLYWEFDVNNDLMPRI